MFLHVGAPREHGRPRLVIKALRIWIELHYNNRAGDAAGGIMRVFPADVKICEVS